MNCSAAHCTEPLKHGWIDVKFPEVIFQIILETFQGE